MPTIFRFDGYRFYFYSHEPNEPPHVHIDKNGSSMKVWLEPVTLAKNTGFRRSEINGIIAMVVQHQARLREAWDEYFG